MPIRRRAWLSREGWYYSAVLAFILAGAVLKSVNLLVILAGMMIAPLIINWRLVMAPPAVLDYIVVHELAHLAEPYHSPKFWLIVQSHCPGYEEHRAWLRDNEQRMRLLS